ncbi:MAG: hypothetical protein ACREE0_22820 [Phenylobacterium sp.]
MLREISCVLAASFLLTACATEPWTQESVRNSVVVREPKDRVWARVINVSPREGLNITNADSANGIISAELSMKPWGGSGDIQDWAVCGAGGMLQRPLSQHVDVKIVVLPDPAGASVTVNARFSELRQDKRTRTTHRVLCTSVGTFENTLLSKYLMN